MEAFNEKDLIMAKEKAQAEANERVKQALEVQLAWDRLVEAGICEHDESVGDVYHGDGCDCEGVSRKKSINKFLDWVIPFVMMMLLFALGCLATAAVMAGNAASDAAQGTQIIARALKVDSTSSVTESSCTFTAGTTYPTPSAAFAAATVGGIMGTGDVTVTPIFSSTAAVNSSCGDSSSTVTVTVTTGSTGASMTESVDGVIGTASFQSSHASTSSAGVFSTVTTTSTSTATQTFTLSSASKATSSASESESDSETTLSSSETHATTSGTSSTDTTSISTAHHTTTTTHSVTVTTTGTAVVSPDTGTAPGTIYLGTGTGTGTGTAGTWTIQPSANGTHTYSVPSASPSQPLSTVIVSSGAAPRSVVGGRGGGGIKKRGGTTGGYCVVMAVACAFTLMV